MSMHAVRSTAQLQRPSPVPVMSQMARLCGHNLRPTLSLCCIQVPPLVLREALGGLHLRLQPSWRHVRLHVDVYMVQQRSLAALRGVRLSGVRQFLGCTIIDFVHVTW